MTVDAECVLLELKLDWLSILSRLFKRQVRGMTQINSSGEKTILDLGEYILDFSAPGTSQAIIDVTTAGLDNNREVIFY